MVAYIYVGVCWVTMRPGLVEEARGEFRAVRGPSKTTARPHAVAMQCPQGHTTLRDTSFQPGSFLAFRCLSTEQLRPQAPMLKLWRWRMSLFLAYLTAVVILSLPIGTPAWPP